jgi:hypothetical protein
MTLDEAIELLEITEDIDKISDEKLREKRKRAMQRWHPDTIPQADPDTKTRYERKPTTNPILLHIFHPCTFACVRLIFSMIPSRVSSFVA